MGKHAENTPLPSLSVAKGLLTKAIRSMDTARGKIPSSLFAPMEDCVRSQPQLLEQRQLLLETHLAELDKAIRTTKERLDTLLAVVDNSVDPEKDQAAYQTYMADSTVEEAVMEANSTLTALKESLEETQGFVEHYRLMAMQRNIDPLNHQQDVPSQATTAATLDSVSPQPNVALAQPPVGQSPPFTLGGDELLSPRVPSSVFPSVKLKHLTLEPFSGDITEFPEFWSMFEVTVHVDPNLDNVLKYMYLRSLLKGEARQVLSDLAPTDHNYFKLVKALKSRYDCPAELCSLLHQRLKDLPPSSTDPKELQSTWHKVSDIVNGIRQYEQITNVRPVIELVRQKFPLEIRRDLHQAEINSGVKFDLLQVLSKLKFIIKSHKEFDNENRAISSTSVHVTHSRSPSRDSSSHSRSGVEECCFCDSTRHKSSRCSVTCHYSIRRATVRRLNLCWICLRRGHDSRSCHHSPCRVCRGFHHEILCRQSSRSRTPSLDRQSSRSGSRSLDKYRHRSPVYRYSSRSPSRPVRSSSSPNHHSRDYSRDRGDSDGDRTPQRSRSSSPAHVSFHSSTKDNNDRRRSTRRSSSPYVKQYQIGSTSPRASSPSASHRSTETTLMLVKALTRNSTNAQLEELYLFLDPGAQRSFITTQAAHRLGLPIRDCRDRTYIGFGGQTTTESSGVVELTLIDATKTPLVVHLTTKQVITLAHNAPLLTPEDRDFIHDHGFDLPSCRSISVIPDALIGIDHYWDIMTVEAPICLPSGMVLCHTRFGTVVSDPTNIFTSSPIDQDTDVQRLWSLDALGISDDCDPALDQQLDQRVIEEFGRSALMQNGFLYVRFPWKTDHPPLGNNKRVAYCRLLEQFQRLHDTEQWTQYISVIDDHISKGYVEDVDFSIGDNSERTYYIPHQAVYKESSSTTKLRVVFDASSKAKGEVSLNDCVHQGPSLLPDLVGTLLRARLHRFLLIADVEKAFHQIRLQTCDRDATRFLWLKDPRRPPSSSNLRILRFTRIPFGVNASPFLLSASIQYYLRTEGSPLCDEIVRNTYVDNVILGASSREESVAKYHQAKQVFGRMHMNLREFLCNSETVNHAISSVDNAVEPSNASLLGIRWQHDRDQLLIPIKADKIAVSTKRSALRALASTFDPLGLLTPFLVPLKLFIQDLWATDLGWDTPLTPDLQQQWSLLLEAIRHPLPPITRLVLSANFVPTAYELCVFGDASKRVYACCSYLVSRNSASAHSMLIMAKSHLNASKTKLLTIPRAELLAILLCVRNAQFLVAHLDLPVHTVHIFSDSLIALHWVHTDKPMKVFVQNRINTIRNIVSALEERNINVHFHYVASEVNPADCATRGLSTNDAQHHLWWTGPSYLLDKPSRWPRTNVNFKALPAEEAQSEYLHVGFATDSDFRSVIPFHRTNHYQKLLNIVVLVLKFIVKRILARVSQDTRDKLCQKISALALVSDSDVVSATDIKAAEIQVILAHYDESREDLQRLNLSNLNAHKDSYGLIRCLHRIGTLETSPILLIPSHKLFQLVAFHYHNNSFHSGTIHVIASIRTRFFAPSLRSHVHKILRSCVTCKKYSGNAYRYPNMPALPAERVTRSRPFQHVGLDYLGPVSCVSTSGKAWICLITCKSTRAVHLEVVVDNTAFEFLLAFRRFVARRGVPSSVESDNSTTFKAAQQAISQSSDGVELAPTIRNYCAKNNITWRFITPLSPWKGGFYERLVALVKSAYKKTVGHTSLPMNQLQTLIIEIEATLNARPITPYRESTFFAHVLRPVDFLIPEGDVQITLPQNRAQPLDSPSSLNQRYDELLEVLEQFWDIWHSEYLAALRERQQQRSPNKRYTAYKPHVGDVVIIADEKLPRGQWPYGLITRLVESSDKCVRSAEVRTHSGHTLTRSIRHLHPLEISAVETPSVGNGSSDPAAQALKSQSEPTPSNAPPTTSSRVQPTRSAKTAHKFINPH